MVRFFTLVFIGIIALMLFKGGPKGAGANLVTEVATDGSSFVETLIGG